MAPSVSITLIGRSYMLCAGGRNIAYDGTPSQSLRNALQHPPGVHNMYIAMTSDDSFYIHFHDNGGRCFDTKRLDEHSGLAEYLKDQGADHPRFVSLSPGGYYFYRSSEGGSAWNLPGNLDTMDLTHVWFGKDDSYVAQKEGGGLLWAPKGHYGSLSQTLRYSTKPIKALGLNVTDGSSYLLLYMDGSIQLNPGRCRLTTAEVRDWVQSWI